jgi:hypothetical protein
VGVAFALLTALELVIGQWAVGEADILLRTTKSNLLHWAVALVLLGAFFSGLEASRIAVRVVGTILAGIGAWGLLSPSTLGDFLGYAGEIPSSYAVLHLLAGVGCLVAGFVGSRKLA